MFQTELVIKRGYKTEEYIVKTEDGYKLLLTRIVTGKSETIRPVFLQHGLLSSSDQWLLQGHDVGLGKPINNNTIKSNKQIN